MAADCSAPFPQEVWVPPMRNTGVCAEVSASVTRSSSSARAIGRQARTGKDHELRRKRKPFRNEAAGAWCAGGVLNEGVIAAATSSVAPTNTVNVAAQALPLRNERIPLAVGKASKDVLARFLILASLARCRTCRSSSALHCVESASPLQHVGVVFGAESSPSPVAFALTTRTMAVVPPAAQAAPSLYFSAADRLYPPALYEASALLWNSKLKEVRL